MPREQCTLTTDPPLLWVKVRDAADDGLSQIDCEAVLRAVAEWLDEEGLWAAARLVSDQADKAEEGL